MAVLFDALTDSTDFTVDKTFDHTPVSTPKAVVLLMLAFNDGGVDRLVGATYGGVALQHPLFLSPLQFTLGAELDGTMYTMILTSDTATIPTGPQTVSIDLSSSPPNMRAYCITLTATGDASTLNYAAQNNQSSANPSVALTITENCFCVGHVISGFDTLASITPGSGMTQLGSGRDFGAEVWEPLYRTTNPTTNTTIDWTAATEDWAATAIAFRDVPSTDVINHDRHHLISTAAVRRASTW